MNAAHSYSVETQVRERYETFKDIRENQLRGVQNLLGI